MIKIKIASALARYRFGESVKRNWDEDTWEGEQLNSSLFFSLEDMVEAFIEGFQEASYRKEVLLKSVEINELDLDETSK